MAVIIGDMIVREEPFGMDRTSAAISDHYFSKAKDVLIRDGFLKPVLFVLSEKSVSSVDLTRIFEQDDMELAANFVIRLTRQNADAIGAVVAGEFQTKVRTNDDSEVDSNAIIVWSQYKGDDSVVRAAFIDREEGKIRRIIEQEKFGGLFLGFSVFDSKHEKKYDSGGLFRGNEQVQD